MTKATRGFASMDKEKQRAIASKGGKAAHAQGKAHEWSSSEARLAGRKGGLARGRSASRRTETPSVVQPTPQEEIVHSDFGEE